VSDRAHRDDETSPFPLEREKDDASPFLLERKTGDHDVVRAPEPTQLEERNDDASPAEAVESVVQFTASARNARRSLVVALGVHSLALLAFASLSLVRWAKGLASPPELALTVLAIGIALLHLRASSRLSRLGREAKHDGAILASTLTGLRAVLVLKALVLFASLALVCFALSMVVSLIASF
jgi:hypothetical protein